MISVAQAQQQLQNAAKSSPETQRLMLLDALGRVASEDVTSAIAIPPSDNSAMDGFAINSADFKSGSLFSLSQRIPAGVQPKPLTAGTAARIFTGGVMPKGADAVVIQENCEYDTEQVTVVKPVTPGANVRPQGQDISQGATVLRKGQRLTAVDLSLLASIGHAEVNVYSPLKVAIFSTGDELIEPGKPLKPGQIYNSNRTLLIALCHQLGYHAIDCGIVEDTFEATCAALSNAASKADLIISSGGVSVGEEDHVKPAVESLGSLAMWKVQMKPGKPVAFGEVLGTPFLGLPGNPVSSYVVFQLLGLPLARALQGQNADLPKAYTVTAGFSMKTTTREEYIRVRLELNDKCELEAQRFANLSSGVMSSLSWANGLVRQNIEQTITEGDKVAFLPLTEGML